jgi:CheY-like chemotaxis protein
MRSRPQRVSIVYIDDDSGDQRLVSEAIVRSETPCQLTVLTSADRALRHFSRIAPRSFHPDLILLDSRLGCEAGCDLVRRIRSNRELQAVPIVVFGLGSNDAACRTALEAGANGCVPRPVDLGSLFRQIEGIVATWTRRAVAAHGG